jgi:hypothetical protein
MSSAEETFAPASEQIWFREATRNSGRRCDSGNEDDGD